MARLIISPSSRPADAKVSTDTIVQRFGPTLGKPRSRREVWFRPKSQSGHQCRLHGVDFSDTSLLLAPAGSASGVQELP